MLYYRQRNHGAKPALWTRRIVLSLEALEHLGLCRQSASNAGHVTGSVWISKVLVNPSCPSSSTGYHRCMRTFSSLPWLQSYGADASQTHAKPARRRGGVAGHIKLSKNRSCLITTFVKLVTDYRKCTSKSEEKTNVNVVIFILSDPLWKPHLSYLVGKESEHFTKLYRFPHNC